MNSKIQQAYHFHNIQVDGSIINHNQILSIIENLASVLEKNLDGDVVELGCYVGESSKYIRKTLDVYDSSKSLTVFDSFEGLPPLSEYEEGTGWKPFTLKTTEDILIKNFENNNLQVPKIVKGWFKDIREEDLPEKICFAFLDGDFYDSIYDSLNQIYDRMVDGGIIMFHDFRRNDLPGVDAAIRDFFNKKGIDYNLEEVVEQVGRHVVGGPIPEGKKEIQINKSKLTLVTGIWDIGRSDLEEGWKRPFQHYLDKFDSLLDTPENMIIFGEEEIRDFVFRKRNESNTQFIVRKLEWFRENEFFHKIQKIRQNPDWYNQVGWLKDSTQAKLENYNPLVMSKMFLLHDAKIVDKFNSEYLFWIDGGLTNTVHPGYFTHDKVFEKLTKNISKFSFVCFPYETKTEIHGFEINKMNEIAGSNVNKVARGGFFGGPKSTISEINNIYYGLMSMSLAQGYMGTEESIFSIMSYKHSDLINYFEIDGNGLMGKFFEDLKNDNLVVKSNSPVKVNLDSNKVGLYVITFNSPKQFETLIESMILYDRDFLLKTEKFLLNNSSDSSTRQEYDRLCKLHDFQHIIPEAGNLGICGGRQFIAEHFEKSDNDFMFFFEDDMFFYNGKDSVCRNGFNRHVKDLYSKSLKICSRENFDFLKLNYTEFYGDNGTQWSWYNVPQHVREEYWPGKKRLPEMGLDPNAPRTEYKNINSYEGVPYVSGEIYYCNWPQIVTKEGNKKMFLETTWAHPFEQTWMSHMYQVVKTNELNPGLFLMTTTSHDRFEHYNRELRKES